MKRGLRSRMGHTKNPAHEAPAGYAPGSPTLGGPATQKARTNSPALSSAAGDDRGSMEISGRSSQIENAKNPALANEAGDDWGAALPWGSDFEIKDENYPALPLAAGGDGGSWWREVVDMKSGMQIILLARRRLVTTETQFPSAGGVPGGGKVEPKRGPESQVEVYYSLFYFHSDLRWGNA